MMYKRTIPDHPRSVASRLVATAMRALSEAILVLDDPEAGADGLASRDRLSGLLRQLEKEVAILRRPDTAGPADLGGSVRFAE